MDSLHHVEQLFNDGLFADALRELDKNHVRRDQRISADVIRAQLYQRLGRARDARDRVATLTRGDLTPSQHSICHLVLGRIEADDGNSDSAVSHLQKSIEFALRVRDFESAAWAQCRLLLIVADLSGPQAAAPILAELRWNAVRSGNPQTIAASHLYCAQIEAQQGLLSSAQRHISLATRILDVSPNALLKGIAEHNSAAIASMRSQLLLGILHARRSVKSAEGTGAAYSLASSVGNLAHLLYLIGDFEQAIECSANALEGFHPDNRNYVAVLDTVARIRLAQNRLSECEDVLDRMQRACERTNRSPYVYRHYLFTRARFLERSSRFEEALEQIQILIELTTAANDRLLQSVALLTQAGLLLHLSRFDEAVEQLHLVATRLAGQPPDVYAMYEGVIACGLATTFPHEARGHFERARRIYSCLGHAPGLIELASSRDCVSAQQSPPDLTVDGAHGTVRPPSMWTLSGLLHSVAMVTAHPDRAELVGNEILQILNAVGCVESAVAVTREADGTEREFARTNQSGLPTGGGHHLRLSIGLVPGATDLLIHPKRDVESIASLNAVRMLLDALQELERARIEREERATLWPAEEQPADGRTVLSGHMREQMSLAQRVANANVNVLITGESGTGKELIARAIHDFSNRATKPFVPFNCAAVPRDLLESQLFGHRRGAFTGADHDQLGLIRAARDGTLFLDEVGELALDLQPKLLRFLESGEIAPLGEPAPMTVNVRVVAATNSNLEDAVRSGRFREDLFYRLNVVRLSLRPLRERRDEIPGLVNHFVARAALESQKGHLTVAEETMERLILYRWPGNVRQLQNELRRMVAMSEPNSTLEPDAIAAEILGALPVARPAPSSGRELAVPLHDKLLPTLARVEGEMIKAAFREHHGKVDAVAKALGISRKGLYLKRQRLGL